MMKLPFDRENRFARLSQHQAEVRGWRAYLLMQDRVSRPAPKHHVSKPGLTDASDGRADCFSGMEACSCECLRVYGIELRASTDL